MKIIQSFWSKPLLMSSNDILHNRFNGGWRNYRYALMAHAYSCLTLKKYYPEVELYTDDYGVRIFKDTLKLPYNKVYDNLNSLNVDEALWAYGKLYTYSLQKEPFIHVDNDIFIWERLPKFIEKADVACQNIEWIDDNMDNDYMKIMSYMHKSMKRVPDILMQANCKYAANMGIFGGNDVDFINRYATLAMNVVKDMYDEILVSGDRKGCFNIIFEQLLLTEYAKMKHKNISYLEDMSTTNDMLRFYAIEAAQYDSKFSHCLGTLKQSDYICQQIEFRLKADFPEYYYRIKDYLDANGMQFPENDIAMSDYDNFLSVYSCIGAVRSRSKILSEYDLRLKPGCKLEYKDNNMFIQTGKGTTALTGMGKLLCYLEDYITGDCLCEYLIHNNIIPWISPDAIKDNVFWLIMQGLYMNQWFEVRKKSI